MGCRAAAGEAAKVTGGGVPFIGDPGCISP